MKRWRWSGVVVVCALVAAVVMLPGPAAAWQAFAKVTSATGTLINGEVNLKGFEGQIELLALGNELTQPLDPASGLPSSKLRLGLFQMAKKFDIATPKFITAMATNTKLKTVEITIFKTTPTGSAPAFKIVLADSLIANMETTYNVGTDPSAVERLELAYTKLTWTDLLTGATGSVGITP